MNNEKLQTLQQHFAELRKRIFFSAIFFLTAFVISYFFSEKIYEFLLQPFAEISNSSQNRKLIYTSPTEAFATYLKLSFFSAIFFSFPILAAEIYLFLSPALYKNEKKNILLTFFSAVFLFLCGAIFSYYFVLPSALKFFASYETQGFLSSSDFSIHLETRISEYLNFVTNFLFAFGVAFQLPILLLFLIKVGCLSIDDLKRRRRYWIVIIFIMSAILTPPDVLSQISLAIPMSILFEITILIGKNFNIKK
jgi:sec-independent protein translocase protein TatC